MCGRFSISKVEKELLKKRFHLDSIPAELKPNYNVAPTHQVPVILNTQPSEIQFAKWGLLPSWSKEEKTPYSLINARAEGITEKPSYRIVKSQRCLILADGFYEWKRVGKEKTPYRFTLKDGSAFAFAGVWDKWARGEKIITSCSIITCGPNDLMKPIHDRMPVILEEHEKWLESFDERLLAPFPAKKMAAYQVSDKVNSVKNNTADILKAV